MLYYIIFICHYYYLHFTENTLNIFEEIVIDNGKYLYKR